jgi:hypothetical protein
VLPLERVENFYIRILFYSGVILIPMNELTVDYCRQLLMNEVKGVSQEELENNILVEKVKDLSLREKFYMAKDLLPELGEYKEFVFMRQTVLNDVAYVYGELRNALCWFEGASLADFEYLVEHVPFCLFYHVLANASFPAALFVEGERVRSYLEDTEGSQLVRSHWSERRNEIITYLRDAVPGFEYMSDDMVMSVTGIDFNIYKF